VITDEKAKLKEGQSLSQDKLTEIILHVFRKARAGQNRPAQDSRGPDGNINDYLEHRRPFMEPNPDSHSH
jgi:hypothetical protein